MIKFFKMHGIGNDYIFIDNMLNQYDIDFGKLSKKISQRHFMVGSDGVVVIGQSKIADAKIDIYNSDGSYASLCGNATRCVAFYLSKKIKRNFVKIESGKKVLFCNVKIISNKMANVCVLMGGVKYIGKNKFGHIVDIGNKHCVVFVKNFDFDIKKQGKKISDDFCGGINVEFVKVVDKKNIKIKVYERGSGITLACGSGACASAFVCKKLGLLSDVANVWLDGGTLKIKTSKNIQMIGTANFVYWGQIC